MIHARLALASVPDIWARIASLRQCDLDLLSPAMRVATIATLRRAHARTISVTLTDGRVDTVALDPIVHETLRSDELQQIYYQQKTTHAARADRSWHYYGLAVDLISIAYEWFDNAAARQRWPLSQDRDLVSRAWFSAIAEIAQQLELAAGIHWPTFPDPPHLQWGRCARSPDDAPRIYHNAGGALRGRQEVWKSCDALFISPALAEAAK